MSSEKFATLVRNSNSVTDMLRKNGYNYRRYNQIIRDRIKTDKVNTSHFGKRRATHRSFKEIFCKESMASDNQLNKKKLLSLRIIEDICSNCGMMGGDITLQIDHINGDSNDNRLENLRVLCPNCHALTGTYCGKNNAENKFQNNKCIKCTSQLSNTGQLCTYCSSGKGADGYRDLASGPIKKHLFRANIFTNRCMWCGYVPPIGYWNQLDHISGDSTDNTLDNLRILCANCHSKTLTFDIGKTYRKNNCNECDVKLQDGHTKICDDCHQKNLKNNPTFRGGKHEKICRHTNCNTPISWGVTYCRTHYCNKFLNKLADEYDEYLEEKKNNQLTDIHILTDEERYDLEYCDDCNSKLQSLTGICLVCTV